MELWRQQALFVVHVCQLIDYIFKQGYFCTFGEAFIDESNIIFRHRLDDSHCKRMAIDLNLIAPTGELLLDKKDYEDLGRFWETLDPENRWGNTETCSAINHFERQEIIIH